MYLCPLIRRVHFSSGSWYSRRFFRAAEMRREFSVMYCYGRLVLLVLLVFLKSDMAAKYDCYCVRFEGGKMGRTVNHKAARR